MYVVKPLLTKIPFNWKDCPFFKSVRMYCVCERNRTLIYAQLILFLHWFCKLKQLFIFKCNILCITTFDMKIIICLKFFVSNACASFLIIFNGGSTVFLKELQYFMTIQFDIECQDRVMFTYLFLAHTSITVLIEFAVPALIR